MSPVSTQTTSCARTWPLSARSSVPDQGEGNPNPTPAPHPSIVPGWQKPGALEGLAMESFDSSGGCHVHGADAAPPAGCCHTPG
eukprot:scaffold120582_cov30-Phaeocystis_antarctica.AAC.1